MEQLILWYLDFIRGKFHCFLLQREKVTETNSETSSATEIIHNGRTVLTFYTVHTRETAPYSQLLPL